MAAGAIAATVMENGPVDDRRESRFISTNSMMDDDHAGAVSKPRYGPLPPAAEEEEITFECINCSG